jgi:hypothetical protein
VGQRTKRTPDVARAKPRAPLASADLVDGAGATSALPSACEQVHDVEFRVQAGAHPKEGDAVRVRNGSQLALEDNGRLVGVFASPTISGCLALGFIFDGEITSVRGDAGTARLRGHS